jgi:Domain of unknown function (DUF5659)
MATKNEYATSDLGLAAALVASGHMLVSVNKDNPRRAIFIFKETGDLYSLADNYFNNSLTVYAQGYFESLKRLKTRLYS